MRSLFLRAVELLRELAPDPVPVPAPVPGPAPLAGGERRLLRELLRDDTISTGRSFHSISGRAFWNDSDGEGSRGGAPLKPGRLRAADITSALGGSSIGAGAGAGAGARALRRGTCSAVRAPATGRTSRRTTHAVSGRSLK